MSTKTESARSGSIGFKGIANSLQKRIELGAIQTGRYLPTERELQHEFGASRSTVRRALAMLVETGWAQNIPSKGAVAGTGNRRTRTNNIALIDHSTYVLRVLSVWMTELLRDRDYHLVHMGGGAEFTIEDNLDYADQNDFAGALVWPYRGFPDQTRVRKLTRRIPTVCLDHSLRGVSADIVTFDYFGAAVQATNQLIRQGCKRIAITGMMDMLETTHARFSGYMQALFDHGLQPSPRDYVFTFTSGMSQPDVEPLVHRLSQSDRPEGIVVIQDQFVPSTIEAAMAAGLSVPDDLRVVTIGDDVDVQIGDVGLTAIALDWETFSRQAVELLIDRIQDPSAPARTLLAPHQLIVRGLCGAPKSQWSSSQGDQITQGNPISKGNRILGGAMPYPKSCYRFSTTSQIARPASSIAALNAEESL